MTPTLTQSERDEIQGRLEKATPGPWNTNEPLFTWIDSHHCCDRGAMHIADIRGWGHLTGKGMAHGLGDEAAIAIQRANADFIAHTPTDIARLLASDAAKDALLADAERRGMERAAEIAHDYLTYGMMPDVAELVASVIRVGKRVCPYPIEGNDGTAESCIANGNCGCDEREIARAALGGT